MALPDDVAHAMSVMNAAVDLAESQHTFFAADKGRWQTIRAHLLSQEAELKILRVKCSGTLANNLCPDHRDKKVGNPCLACTIEKLQSRLAAASALLRECRRFAAWASERMPEALPVYENLDAHLSENTHDRA